ncbi:MAG: GtrA family protein [Candidatus Methanoperedens sp.]|nr:GtrA family protein [Candidatus Methanoperedens sp.]
MFEKQISRFIFVGILNTIVGYGAYFILLYLNIYYMLALLISHIIGVTNSFIWNKKWTFQSEGNARREGIKFFSVYGIIFMMNLFILTFFVEGLKLTPQIGQVVALGICTMISYFGHKYWSFRL